MKKPKHSLLSPIYTKVQHHRALKQIEKLMDADPRPGTFASQYLLELACYVDAYESLMFPITKNKKTMAVRLARRVLEKNSQ